jgi:histidinol-phosphatase (PHP family)
LIRLADYHIHTRFSVDSRTELEDACEAAIAADLDEIAFTDHADFGHADTVGYLKPAEYVTAVERCRDRYAGRLAVRLGVEMGEPHIFAQETRDILAAGEFDLVLGSVHYADGMVPAWKEEYFEQPLHEAYEAYFRLVARLAAEGDFDVLGHLDLVKRDARKFGKVYDGPEPYGDLIRTALRSIVERGKGIEINTSPLRRGQPDACPSLEVLQWYRELGGEILTLGSDAHRPGDVGACFDAALEMARTAGFKRLARFEKRRVRWMEI